MSLKEVSQSRIDITILFHNSLNLQICKSFTHSKLILITEVVPVSFLVIRWKLYNRESNGVCYNLHTEYASQRQSYPGDIRRPGYHSKVSYIQFRLCADWVVPSYIISIRLLNILEVAFPHTWNSKEWIYTVQHELK